MPFARVLVTLSGNQKTPLQLRKSLITKLKGKVTIRYTCKKQDANRCLQLTRIETITPRNQQKYAL